jgi:hypothetical protein
MILLSDTAETVIMEGCNWENSRRVTHSLDDYTLNVHCRCTLHRTDKMFLIFLNRRGDTVYHAEQISRICNFMVLDFKLSPCSECCILSFGWFSGIWSLYADVSQHSVSFISIGGVSRRKSVPKRRHIKFRHRRITQKKGYNFVVQIDMAVNEEKAWNPLI